MFSKYIFVYRKIRLTWNSGWVHVRNLNVQGRESQNKEAVTVPQTSSKIQQIKREGVVKSNAEDSNLGQLFSSSLLESWTSASVCQSHLSWWFKWHELWTIIRSFEQKQKYVLILASEHLLESQSGGTSPQVPVVTKHSECKLAILPST